MRKPVFSLVCQMNHQVSVYFNRPNLGCLNHLPCISKSQHYLGPRGLLRTNESYKLLLGFSICVNILTYLQTNKTYTIHSTIMCPIIGTQECKQQTFNLILNSTSTLSPTVEQIPLNGFTIDPTDPKISYTGVSRLCQKPYLGFLLHICSYDFGQSLILYVICSLFILFQ